MPYFYGYMESDPNPTLWTFWNRIVQVANPISTRTPWSLFELAEGPLQPESRHGISHPLGFARLHHRNGWSLLSFWDRSLVDDPQGKGAFLFEGHHSFHGMLDFAEEWFPKILQRVGPLIPETESPVTVRSIGWSQGFSLPLGTNNADTLTISGGVVASINQSMAVISPPTFADQLEENEGLIHHMMDQHLASSVAAALLLLTPEQRDGIRILLDKLADQGI